MSETNRIGDYIGIPGVPHLRTGWFWRRRLRVLAMALLAWPALCDVAQTQQRSEPCGLFSSTAVRPLVVPNAEPTAIRIMPSRYKDLLEAQDGYRRTGLNYVAYNGQRFIPAGFGDDAGIYYYIPWLSRKLHVDLSHAISLFFITVMILAVVSGGWGLMLSLRGWRGRAAGIIALGGLAFIAYRLGDVYIFEFAVPTALIPWVMRHARRQTYAWMTGLLFAAVGLLIGAGATVRTAAGIPTLLFVLVLIATHFKSSRVRRTLLASLVMAGILCPFALVHQMAQPGDSFLLSQAGWKREELSRHTFWQLVYIGEGFLSNPYVAGGVCDDIGKAKVWSVAPEASYLSRQYDQVLRDEVVAIAKHHPLLLLFTMAAKLGIVLVMIAIFANLGLVAAIVRPKPWGIETAFWAALAASAAPVILVSPSPQYLIGIFSLAALYGVFSIDHTLQPRGGSAGAAAGLTDEENLELAAMSKESYEPCTANGH